MDGEPPLLSNKHYQAESAFAPENLLREARRQRGLRLESVPQLCVLDPDGDMVRQFSADGRAVRDDNWACYHTELWRVECGGREIGIVGCAVGAPFAVLVAEELFASGCALLISVTSSGQLVPVQKTPYFVLIDQALRDEGTSYHYEPPSEFSAAPAHLIAAVKDGFKDLSVLVLQGATWTTDAPFRETEGAIAAMKEKGLLAVEMEAAALYAFARMRQKDVLCFAHVTNQMAQIEGDFEKGEADGAPDALSVVLCAAKLILGQSETQR
jgi:uridine phosphorylase